MGSGRIVFGHNQAAATLISHSITYNLDGHLLVVALHDGVSRGTGSLGCLLAGLKSGGGVWRNFSC